MKRSFMESLVAHAILAPNSHNTQPWLFRIGDDAIQLRADRSRSLPVVDPMDRSLIISCGAALGTLRAAALGAGYAVEVLRFPDPADADLLAIVTLGKRREPTELERTRARAITRRRTNRGVFKNWDVPEAALRQLQKTAIAEGIGVNLLTDADEKLVLADLIEVGDHQQASDPAFRKEAAHWLHSNVALARDGMPANTFGVGDIPSIPYPWIVRSFNWGNSQGAKDHELASHAPALAIVTADADTEAAWLRTGEALALMLLDLTAAGLATSFFNQPVEVNALRTELRSKLGLTGLPQMIFRIGYGNPVPAAPRRVLSDVVLLN